jgi:endonuclease I
MGHFYLSKQNGEYAVKDVYCDRLVSESEFKSHKPGPNRIPDSRVINAEHTWPQSKFSGMFSKEMQRSDLHHLFPTDSEMNSARSSYPFGEVVQDSLELKCRDARMGSVAESRGTYFEPPKGHKGNVARALFYFSIRYQMNIDSVQEKYLRAWHLEDAPDDEELRRNEEIYLIQGNRNPFIDHPEVVDLIDDF